MAQQDASALTVRRILSQLTASRQISHREYHQLYAAILSDNQIDADERLQINQLFDAIAVLNHL